MSPLSPAKPADLDQVIGKLLAKMLETDPGTDQYAKLATQLAGLYKLKEQSAPKRVNPDTWVLAAVNLIGIVLIIKHEHVNIITTKALGFIMRPR